MTENEAKTKWCPKVTFVFTPEGNVLSSRGNIVHPDDVWTESSCMCSECVWWMWDTSPRQIAETNARQEFHHVASGHCGAIK